MGMTTSPTGPEGRDEPPDRGRESSGGSRPCHHGFYVSCPDGGHGRRRMIPVSVASHPITLFVTRSFPVPRSGTTETYSVGTDRESIR